MKPTVLLADDHSLFVEGICRILEHEYDIVGRLCDAAQLLEQAIATGCDEFNAKPIEFEGLIGTIRRVLGKSKPR